MNLKKIISEVTECAKQIELYNGQKKYADMICVCGRLTGYSKLLCDIAQQLANVAYEGLESDGENKTE